jgi:Raf kinase inhibitor-like YbhB/YbcL family protein
MRNLILSSVLLSTTAATAAPAPKSLTVTSSAFSANGAIPSEYTCDGAGKSPPLSWSGVPANTQTIAILVDDPDAPKGVFTHWLVTNIPPHDSSLSEGGSLPQGALAASGDSGSTGYTPPCPPSGTHRYRFHVFALDRIMPKPTSRGAFAAQIKGHVLAEGELVGTYQKR